MRHALLLTCLLASSAFAAGNATATKSDDKTEVAARPLFNAALAQRLGADEYGMRSYVMVILKTGPTTDLTKEQQAELFKGHMANIGRLASEGKLAVAGPMVKNDKGYRGIFVFDVATVEEAKALVESDPAVAAGIFDYEAYGWYASAALREVDAIHRRIEKSSP